MAAAGLANSGYAQLEENSGYAQLEEVVVTAQKRTQNVNDVGITISAFTGEQLQDFGVLTAEDLALLTPGLTVNETAATGVPIYTIRGVGFQDYSTAASSTVGLYFDEVALPYTVMTRGLVFDTERLEILKGPQGDLYGRNTTAGQINFISNKPTTELATGFTVGYSNYQTWDVEGFFSGGFSDNVAGRLAFKHTKSSEGWQKSLTRDDELGKKDVSALRGTLSVDFSDNGNLLLLAHYVADDSENRANTAYDGRIIDQTEYSRVYTPLEQYRREETRHENFGQTPPWYSTDNNEAADWTNSYTSTITGRSFNLRPQRDNELVGLTAQLNVGLTDDMTLTLIAGYNDFERIEANDWDGGFYNDSSNINTTDLLVKSYELRLAGETGQFSWVAGLYYASDEMDEYYHYFFSDSGFSLGATAWELGGPPFADFPILELDTRYQQETESAAVFGHAEWQLTDALRLVLGARYTSEDRDWSGCTFVADDGSLAAFLNAAFMTTLGPGDCGTIDDHPNSPTYFLSPDRGPVNDAFHVYTSSIETKKWMGKVGLDYNVSENVLLYGLISHGFKSGGFNGANSNTTRQLGPYREEELTAYEIGSKATLLNKRMQLNAAAFYYDYRDKQEQDVAVTFVGNISGLTNVPESEVYGAELDLQWQPTEGLSIHFSAAWLDTEVKKWDAVDRPASSFAGGTVTRDVSGADLPQSPEWSYTGLVKYEWPIGNGLLMEAAVDLSYTDETSGGINIEEATEDYTVYNARLGIRSADGSWRALLWGRNISDEDYYPAAYTGGNGPYVRSYAMPITYGVTLSYSFAGEGQ